MLQCNHAICAQQLVELLKLGKAPLALLHLLSLELYPKLKWPGGAS